MGWEWHQGVAYARVPYPPDAVWGQARHVLTAAGAQQVTTAGNQISAVLVSHSEPDVLTALVLFLLCIIPGIIYLITASKDSHAPVMVQVSADGLGTLVVASGPGAPMFARMFAW